MYYYEKEGFEPSNIVSKAMALPQSSSRKKESNPSSWFSKSRLYQYATLLSKLSKWIPTQAYGLAKKEDQVKNKKKW